MKVPSFNEFLSESSHEKYKIVVLTRKPENDENTKVFKTSQRIEEEAKIEKNTRKRKRNTNQHQRGIIGEIPQSDVW